MSTFLQELQIYNELVHQAKEDIKTMYLDENDKGHWAVAWSGGKDSTAVLKLVTEAIMELPKEQRNRHVYAVMSDTVVENPELDIYMRDQLQKFNDWAKREEAPFSGHMVERPVERGYFYCLLGKGHPLPSQSIRWCTDRLKIKPQENFLVDLAPSFVLSGVRRSESVSRGRSIEKRSISEKIALYDGGKLTKAGTKIFMAIVDFTVEDVWRLLRQPTLWGDTEDIRRIYRDATGECGFVNPKGVEKKSVEACGARFGCWTCPVIVADRSTEEMAKQYEWLKPLTQWRELHMRMYGRYKPLKPQGQPRKVRSLVIKKYKAIAYATLRVTKAGYGRRGEEYNVGAGTLSLESREFLLQELLKTQAEVNRLRAIDGLEPLELIRKDELYAIIKLQEEDRKQRQHIAGSKLGIKFDRRMLFEDMEETYVEDVAKLAHLTPDEIADRLIENFKQGIYEFPTE
ncbi:phosphoadenosine phosphosulfate reductase family protein [Neobacillus rhizosphaerae]|uniref:phosphoadenosine phosphosulfate reductase domain-containing protein n=1 Tax=Neobacillus rhizosphaerae TaxID=2880965 RepID=UPI003D2D3FE4